MTKRVLGYALICLMAKYDKIYCLFIFPQDGLNLNHLKMKKDFQS